jgi:hypothetical protein
MNRKEKEDMSSAPKVGLPCPWSEIIFSASQTRIVLTATVLLSFLELQDAPQQVLILIKLDPSRKRNLDFFCFHLYLLQIGSEVQLRPRNCPDQS